MYFLKLDTLTIIPFPSPLLTSFYPFFPFLLLSPCIMLFHSSTFPALNLVLSTRPPSLPSPSPFCPPDCEPKGHLSPESPVYLNRSPPFDIHLLGDRRREKGRPNLATLSLEVSSSTKALQVQKNEMSVFRRKLTRQVHNGS